MDLVIGIPTSGLVPIAFANSLAKLTSYITKDRINFSIDIHESASIHANREIIISRAIQASKTHLLFLDHDMTFEPGIVDILISRQKEVVITNYVLKKEPALFTAVNFDGFRIATTEKSVGIVPVAYGGFGVSLFDLEVFKHAPQPWFLPQWIPEIQAYTTEDNSCFQRLRDNGAIVYLDHDASKLINGHIGSKIYRFSPQHIKVL